MDKEEVKRLIELTVADNEFKEQLIKYADAENWSGTRLLIETLLEKYDITNMNTNSTQLMKVKVQLYKVTQNLYSEFMEMFNKYLDNLEVKNESKEK